MSGKPDPDFEAVQPDEKRGFGQAAILVCGCPAERRPQLDQFVRENNFAATPLIYAGTPDLDLKMKDVFGKDAAVLPEESRMPWAIVFSGLPNREFCRFIDRYRAVLGPPIPFWGVRMPPAENWTLRRLLGNYHAEARAFARKA